MSFDSHHVKHLFLTEGAGAKKLWDKIYKVMQDSTRELRQHSRGNTSYSIGGNFLAGSSGEVNLVGGYTVHNYGFSSVWDLALQIGTNLGGEKKYYEHAQEVFMKLKKLAEKAKPNRMESSDTEVFHAYFDDGTVSCIVKGGTNFITVAVKKTFS